ncbi:lipoprotein [Mesoplasma photuris]|uniref:lipoprotein n=1 Tax=Mesoplasma photuris TaxID=217731 RepID=UPI000569349C|nr:lipoprotein [Mesoplasma photuris]
MKKLITLLSAITLTTSAVGTVVACSDKSDDINRDNEDANGNAIFIDAGGNISNVIDAERVNAWISEHTNVLGKEGVQKFYNLFAYSFLEKLQTGEIKIDETSLYLNDGDVEFLSKALGKRGENNDTVYGKAEAEFKKLEKKYEDDADGLIKELSDLFPGLKRDKDILKNAFISDYVLNNESNNAMSVLVNRLGFKSDLSLTSWENGVANKNTSNQDDQNQILSDLNNRFRNNPSINSLPINQLAEKLPELVSNENGITELGKTLIDMINLVGGITAVTEFGTTTSRQWTTNDLQWATQENLIATIKTESFISNLVQIYNKSVNASIMESGNTIINLGLFTGDVFTSIKGITDIYELSNGDNVKQFYTDLTFNQMPILSNGISKQSSSTSNYGFVKNSQKFIIDKFFNVEKPLAITDIVFNASSTQQINTKVDLTSFSDFASPEDTIKKFAGIGSIFTNYIGSDAAKSVGKGSEYGLTAFDGITKNFSTDKGVIIGQNAGQDIKWDSANYTANSSPKLLTLNSSTDDFSNTAKYSLYDFANNSKSENGGAVTKIAYSHDNLVKYGVSPTLAAGVESAFNNTTSIRDDIKKNAKEGIAVIQGLIDNLNKEEDAKPYQIIDANEGIIGYLDEKGYHISKIEGFNLLEESKTAQTGAKLSTADQTTQEDYLKQAYNFKLVQSEAKKNNKYLPFALNATLLGSGTTKGETSSMAGDEETGSGSEIAIYKDIPMAKIETQGLKDLSFNNHFVNKYEQFLVNNSILAKELSSDVVSPFYGFDIFSQAQSSIYGTEEVPALNQSWMFDFISIIIAENNPDSKSSLEDAIDLLIEFDEDDTTFKDKIVLEIKNSSINYQRTVNHNFDSNNQIWIKDLENNKEISAADETTNPNNMTGFELNNKGGDTGINSLNESMVPFKDPLWGVTSTEAVEYNYTNINTLHYSDSRRKGDN